MFKKLSALLLVVILLRTSFAAADSVLPASRKTIAPFFDLTWEEVDEHGSNAYSMLSKEGYASAWKNRHGMVQINGNTISNAIKAERESYLQFVWQHLGQAA